MLVTAALLGLRLLLASRVGLGDAEALYVSYALFPQPGYLDHPGLVGFVARSLGSDGKLPSAWGVHAFTAVLASLVPWIGGLAAHGAGADLRGVSRTVLALALVPELALGLFGLTPDLLLAVTWLGALGAAAAILRRNGDVSFLVYLALGACLGLGILAKVSAGLLALAVAVALLGAPGVRTRPMLWVAALLTGILVWPWVHWEWSQGLPMFRHRLISTQSEAGLSLRNVGALLGGQLLYVTPPFLYGSYRLLQQLRETRQGDPCSRLLWIATLLPAVVLAALCLWSRVAEPHWLAPAYLALSLQLGRGATLVRWVTRSAIGVGVAAVALAFAWVGTDWAPRLPDSIYRARYDLANDLYAWESAAPLLQEAVKEAAVSAGRWPVVVGPHWIVCAQAQYALGAGVHVGCATKVPDDFDRWLPRERWRRQPVVLFVSDSRFEDVRPSDVLPGRIEKSRSRVSIRRGGRVVRTVSVSRLELPDGLALSARQSAAGASRARPASRINASSVLVSGLPVVSN